jgi:hypothetical protein
MDEALLPLLLLSGRGGAGTGGGLDLHGLLPLLLRGPGETTESGTPASSITSASSTGFAPMLATQLQRYRGRRVKLVLATSTLYPGGQLIIATIQDILDDYVVVTDIEVNGVPVVDPSFLLVSTAQIYAVEPIDERRFFLELLWKVQAFRGCGTISGS